MFSNDRGSPHWYFLVTRTSLDTSVEVFSYTEKKGVKDRIRTVERKEKKLDPFSFNKDVIICPLSKPGPASDSLRICHVNRQESPCPGCMCSPFVLWETSPALLGMLAALFPNTSRLPPNSCWHALYQNLPLSSPHKDGASTTWLRALLAQLQSRVQAKMPLLSPLHEQELETSTLTPKIVFFKKSGRTCVYWQFINKHQPPCKLFTKECSEVRKCEYK